MESVSVSFKPRYGEMTLLLPGVPVGVIYLRKLAMQSADVGLQAQEMSRLAPCWAHDDRLTLWRVGLQN